jgi:hypothetical protein
MGFWHLPLDGLSRFFLTFAEVQKLFVAVAACVAAAFAVGVSVSASGGTVLFAAFFYGFGKADGAQARRTGTFCLGCCSHFAFSW